jgi:hypothetical protein
MERRRDHFHPIDDATSVPEEVATGRQTGLD